MSGPVCWKVKIWDLHRSSPLFIFDLSAPLADVAWAPYSSTVFAGATSEGKVHVFDLHISKYSPVCVQGEGIIAVILEIFQVSLQQLFLRRKPD